MKKSLIFAIAFSMALTAAAASAADTAQTASYRSIGVPAAQTAPATAETTAETDSATAETKKESAADTAQTASYRSIGVPAAQTAPATAETTAETASAAASAADTAQTASYRSIGVPAANTAATAETTGETVSSAATAEVYADIPEIKYTDTTPKPVEIPDPTNLPETAENKTAEPASEQTSTAMGAAKFAEREKSIPVTQPAESGLANKAPETAATDEAKFAEHEKGIPAAQPTVTAPVTTPAAPTTTVTEPVPAASFVATTAANPSELAEAPEETHDSYMVSAEWLKDNLNNVVLIDTRPDSLYVTSHIPGAVNAPWTYFTNQSAPSGSLKWGTVWPEETMAKRLAALGINKNKTIVCYSDAGDWGQGAHLVWILRMSGIKNAKMLDGGIYAWKNIKGQLSTNKATGKGGSVQIAKYAPGYTVDTQWIKDNLGKPNLVIIDVRTINEYKGKIRPFREKRGGHLPGALHIPTDEFTTKDGKLKSAEEIVSLLASYNVTPANEIVVYDTAGVRAAFVSMAIRCAGFKKNAVYDEGFQAWAGDSTLALQ